MKKIMVCSKCDNYTMELVCCEEKTIKSGPAKFNPKDSYGAYRRKVKLDTLKESGLV
tara:strand:- start:26294 stop:26464 length:171 start_codon:yes stop_codon:yes gene_type:complete